MAYDEELAAMIGAVLADESDVSSRRMFGGLAFLVGGHMAVAAVRAGGLMVRVDPAESAELTARPGVEPMVMQGRELGGWVVVDAAELENAEAIEEWVGRGVGVVKGLPPKG